MAEACASSIPCCQTDPFSYQSSQATASGSSNGSDCIPALSVSVTPPNGAYVAFPTAAILWSNDAAAVIYYTVDGSAPTQQSSIYTGPVAIESQQTRLKAIAYKGQCASPILQVQYRHNIDFEFSFLCPPDLPAMDDYAGVWNGFIANGHPDYHWHLHLNVTGALGIQKIIIYETKEDGSWNTGQAWCTQQYNDTRPQGPENFNTYPLVFIDSNTLVQVNNAYSSGFSAQFFGGDLPAATYSWDLYGEIQVDLTSAWFRCEIHKTDGTKLYQVISGTCTPPPPPPPCPTPAPPVVSSQACNCILLTWDAAFVSDSWLLMRQTVDGGETSIVGDITTPQPYEDCGLELNTIYRYYILAQTGNCYRASNLVEGRTLDGPHMRVYVGDVEAPASLEVDSGATVTFGFSGFNLQGTIECPAAINIYKIVNNVPVYLATDSPAPGLWPNPDPDTVWITEPITETTLFRFIGCNDCGTVTVEVTVTVCNPKQETDTSLRVQLVDPGSITRDFINPPFATPVNCYQGLPLACTSPVSDPIPWDGVFHYSSSGYWYVESPCSDIESPLYLPDANGIKMQVETSSSIWYELANRTWHLVIYGHSYHPQWWHGTKVGGCTPAGTYNRLLPAECMENAPLQLTVIDL